MHRFNWPTFLENRFYCASSSFDGCTRRQNFQSSLLHEFFLESHVCRSCETRSLYLSVLGSFEGLPQPFQIAEFVDWSQHTWAVDWTLVVEYSSLLEVLSPVAWSLAAEHLDWSLAEEPMHRKLVLLVKLRRLWARAKNPPPLQQQMNLQNLSEDKKELFKNYL